MYLYKGYIKKRLDREVCEDTKTFLGLLENLSQKLTWQAFLQAQGRINLGYTLSLRQKLGQMCNYRMPK